MKTVSQIAKDTGLTRARIHQLIKSLGIAPVRVEGAFGTGFIYQLHARDEAKILQTKRIAKPKKD